MTTLSTITDAIARNIAMNNDLLITLRGLSPELQKEFAPQVQEYIENTERIIRRLRQLMPAPDCGMPNNVDY